MTNGEKFKSAEERAKAFDAFCKSHSSKCDLCPLEKECDDGAIANFSWLELEVESDKPLPCPFCGSNCADGDGYVECLNNACCYSSGNRNKPNALAVAEHNRVARAVMADREKEHAEKDRIQPDSSDRGKFSESVKMEEEFHFAVRHGTLVGDDPVFDELYDYAAKLRAENAKFRKVIEPVLAFRLSPAKWLDPNEMYHAAYKAVQDAQRMARLEESA